MKFDEFQKNLRSLSEGAFKRLISDEETAYNAGFEAARNSGRTFVKAIPVPEHYMVWRKDYVKGFMEGLQQNRRLMG